MVDLSYREFANLWLAKNPIRIWRQQQGLFLKDVAAACNTGYHTVYRWENGMTMPNAEQVRILSKLAGNPRLQDELREWQEQRPLLSKGE